MENCDNPVWFRNKLKEIGIRENVSGAIFFVNGSCRLINDTVLDLANRFHVAVHIFDEKKGKRVEGLKGRGIVDTQLSLGINLIKINVRSFCLVYILWDRKKEITKEKSELSTKITGNLHGLSRPQWKKRPTHPETACY
jgi:hypothetical protein